MAKKKSSQKTARKPTKKASSNARGNNGVAKGDQEKRPKLTHERLRKLAKKHRPPDDYFVGEMERPW